MSRASSSAGAAARRETAVQRLRDETGIDEAMIDALAKGDEVVVAGGLIGRVAKLGESMVNVEVASGVELQVQRSSVVQVLPKGTFGKA